MSVSGMSRRSTGQVVGSFFFLFYESVANQLKGHLETIKHKPRLAVYRMFNT